MLTEEDIKRKRGHPLPPADKIHHILEDFSANWDRPNAHIKPLAVFLRRTLKERTQCMSSAHGFSQYLASTSKISVASRSCVISN